MTNRLDKLVAMNCIKSWKIENVDENGNVGAVSKFRNTQRLTLVFPNDKILVIDSFCSGCAENTTLFIS